MGSACCIAERDKTQQNGTNSDAFNRTRRRSPSWSYQRDRRGRVASDVDNAVDEYSHEINRNIDFNTKGGREIEFVDILDGGSPVENFSASTPQRTPVENFSASTPQRTPSDLSNPNSLATEVKDFVESPSWADPLVFSATVRPKAEPSSSQSHLLPAYLMPPSHDCNPPASQHLRQVSVDRASELNFPKTSVSEGRSHVPPTSSNELVGCSHGGSSDVLSMFAFSEPVSSSHRYRWSFDSKALDFALGSGVASSNRLLASPSIDTQTCGACFKLLTHRSAWGGQKIIITNELPAVAILVCGHVYHAECLENITPETDRYDPPCPVCTTSGKQLLKMHCKTLSMEANLKTRNRKSRSQVMDSYVENYEVAPSSRRGTGSPKIGSSSSMKGPFLRRHFSLGSKPPKPILENDGSSAKASGRRGFWARYH